MQIFSSESNNSRNVQHWTETVTKSDSQVESLINVAEFKANSMGKLHYY